MTRRRQALEQIRRDGLEALVAALGPVDTVRFLQQFESGTGDYSYERHRWLDGLGVQEVTDAVRRARTAEPE